MNGLFKWYQGIFLSVSIPLCSTLLSVVNRIVSAGSVEFRPSSSLSVSSSLRFALTLNSLAAQEAVQAQATLADGTAAAELE